MNRLSRLPLMVVSFVLSIVLWTYVQTQEDPFSATSPSFSVAITVVNKPEDLVILDRLPTFNVVPLGAADEIQRINDEDLVAELDLANGKPGTANYLVRLKTKRQYSVTWNRTSSQLPITLDRMLRSVPKRVAVLPRGRLIDPNLEFVRQNTSTDPAFVYVSGPKSQVDRVDHAQVVLELSTASSGQVSTSAVELVDNHDFPVPGSMLTFEPKSVTIRPSIAFAPETKLVLVSPTFKGAPAYGYRVKRISVQPTQIEVKGRSQALLELSVVQTPEIDISGITATTNFNSHAALPTNVTATGSTAVVVTVVIEPVPAGSGESSRRSSTSPGESKGPGGQ